MTKIKYIKACPFLRDLEDSYLCINNDKVVDVILDPLMHIEWNEQIPPVASEIPNQESCLFVLKIEDNGKLYCLSRKMYLQMDKKEIEWNDIRDSVILLNLNKKSEFQESDIDFCSICLYKVLIASSPVFQKRLNRDEKIRLGIGYILNKANEIQNNLIELSNSFSKIESIKNTKQIQKKFKLKSFSSHEPIAFSWMLWITNNIIFDNEFVASAIEWFQKFDEWGLTIFKISEAKDNNSKIILIEQAIQLAFRLKDISYEIVLRLGYFKEKNLDDIALKNSEKIFIITVIYLEDFIFICNQFLSTIKENKKD